MSNRWVDASAVTSSVEEQLKTGWHANLAEALGVATREQKPVLIDMWATWCKNCLVMDRTTLGRNILPLQRDGLIEIAASPKDRRRRELCLSAAGAEKLHRASERWAVAQTRFDAVFGSERAARLRDLLREVVASEFAAAE